MIRQTPISPAYIASVKEAAIKGSPASADTTLALVAEIERLGKALELQSSAHALRAKRNMMQQIRGLETEVKRLRQQSS